MSDRDQDQQIDSTELWPTARVRAWCGDVSHMWIERRLKDDPTFPRPIYIAKRRYWHSGAMIKWVRSLATRDAVAA